MIVMSENLISFVIICHDAEKTISDCIDHINTQDLPKGLDKELIVVDDFSKDNTLILIDEMTKIIPHLKIIKNQKNMGRGYSRDIGIKHAKGNYIAFVDADIILPKDWLSRLLPCMDDYDAAGGIATPDGDITYICRTLGLIAKVHEHTSGITGSNSIYKHYVFQKVRFKKHMVDGEDTDLVWEMERIGYKTKVLKTLISEHRHHTDYLTFIRRIYSHGFHANHHLFNHNKLRAPDIAFLIFLLITIYSMISIKIAVILMAIYLWTTSILHITKKCIFRQGLLPRFIQASIIYILPMFSYHLGRFRGLILHQA